MATTESEQFAALLRELKDRSGRSYGVLAGRLHMSTSTLHRYCNGDAVPNEYAPVERLARLCGASPEESVELHRRWILADEARRRARGTTPPQPPAATAAAAAAESTPENPPGAAPTAPTEPTEPTPPVDTADAELPAVGPAVAGKRVRRPGLPGRRLSKRTRLALIGAAVVAVAVPVTALATLSDRPSGSGSGSDTVADAGTSTPLGTRSAVRPSASASPSTTSRTSSTAPTAPSSPEPHDLPRERQ
ncbi:helix-turn-helix transcriptional regulator, partial [Streptomyces hundungensis]|uniref:helix-turn-helix domain-containing protein n=1 Tax=Streptomyces hundungensis TaxID=1077946 RepID=UPI0033CA1D51